MKPYVDIDERALLLLLLEGDATAFESLYMRYAEKLSAQLFHLLKSWDEVEEALQQLFVKVWESRENIDPEKSFQAYLYRIASNIANDYYRKLSKDKKLATSLLQQITLLYHPEHLTTQIRADEELMRTIEKLPPQRKTVFKLCKLEGKSYAEVSRMLSISEATIGDHIAKANRFIYNNYDNAIFMLSLIYAASLLE
jgi:RNA polymerase sigma-70 factor (ECF subfamily)